MTRCISRSWCAARATSRCRFSATTTAIWCICSSATARCSGATRRWSSARRRSFSREAQRAGAVRGGARDRPRRQLCQRRHGGVPAGRRQRQVLFHRGQSAHPGRAHGHRSRSPASTSSRRRSASPRASASAAPESGVPAQGDIRLSAHALQCRITTEDPENNFIPDYGQITAYREPGRLRHPPRRRHRLYRRDHHALLRFAAGEGDRLGADAARRRSRACTARCGSSASAACATNLRFLDQLITHPRFARRRLHDALHRRDAGAVHAGRASATAPPRILTTRPTSSSTAIPRPAAAPRPAQLTAAQLPLGPLPAPPPGTKQQLDELGPERFAQWMLRAGARAGHRHHDARRASVAARDAHAHAST